MGEITESWFLGWGKYIKIMVAINSKGLTLGWAVLPLYRCQELSPLAGIFGSRSAVYWGKFECRRHSKCQGIYLGEILGKGKQKYSTLGYFVFGIKPKA